ncbi:hypothetical protein MYAM1_003336 [Malassezia yamatoensis]|uniref:BRCA2 OB1 domain-containing protein n=1 Tax=Malassezia yamatoensis TaxID=253288 RepID=A0AAJ5Z1I4_9BASI|nr:hypothetical protein MYAM1_003336 [Malassezia yamatoensis]
MQESVHGTDAERQPLRELAPNRIQLTSGSLLDCVEKEPQSSDANPQSSVSAIKPQPEGSPRTRSIPHLDVCELELEEESDTDLDTGFFESLDESAWLLLDQSVAPTANEDLPQPPVEADSMRAAPVGFAKANGKRMARPSTSALQNAAKRLHLDQDWDDMPLLSQGTNNAKPFVGECETLAEERHSSVLTATPQSESVSGWDSSIEHNMHKDPPLHASEQTDASHSHEATPFSKPSTLLSTPLRIKSDPSSSSTHITPRHTQPRSRPGSALGTTRARMLSSSLAQRIRTPSISVSISPSAYRSGRQKQNTPHRPIFTPPFKSHPSQSIDHRQREPALVFDLQAPNNRQTYRQAGFWPRPQTYEAAIARGVPMEACDMLVDPCSSRVSQNLMEHAHPVQEALDTLHKLGAKRATFAWVENHLVWIVWKLAGYAVSSSEPESWWSWARVLDQLRYRYQRETMRGQHSCVKRIQECTAPANRPMVLCVHRIESLPQVDDQPACFALHLTDGWYKIRAELDSTLQRAVLQNKIRVGQKLGITSAQLHAFGDGTPVLSAMNSSELHLHANSTALVAWDTRLGFAREEFVSSLTKISSDGGVIGAMDIVLDRVYPSGYQEGHKDARGIPSYSSKEHGLDQELELQADWQQKRKWAQEEVQKIVQRVRTILTWLESHTIPSGQLEDSEWKGKRGHDANFSATQPLLGDLERRDDALSSLRAMEHDTSKQSTLSRLLVCARERDFALSTPNSPAYDAALNFLCAERLVRQRCVVRFHDARPLSKNIKRSVQLTTYDPPELQVGDRFIVTQLVPTQPRSWRGRDVEADAFLSTTRTTRWHRAQ